MMADLPTQESMFFDGETYDHARDQVRLGKQAYAVFNVMQDGRWRSLRQISDAAGCPEASASARLRDFRKERFGSHAVERENRGGGNWWYRLTPNKGVDIQAKLDERLPGRTGGTAADDHHRRDGLGDHHPAPPSEPAS